MDALKVVFIGTGEFGVPTLKSILSDENLRIPLVITGRDKPAGRKLELKGSPIKEIALKNKLIVQQPEHIIELKQKLIQEKPDFLLVVAYGEIIPQEILKIPRFGAINIHASLLPKYRGASPIQEALLHDDVITGITWILMDKKMDEGHVILKKELRIENSDNYETLSKKLSEFASKTTVSVLTGFAKNKRATPQDDSKATYCRKITKEDGLIDLKSETAVQIVNKIRAYTPWPGCFIFWNGKRLKIIQAAASEQKISSGEVKAEESKILALGTQKGALLLKRVQLEGKKEMDIEEFLRGQKNIPQKIAISSSFLSALDIARQKPLL